jgi:hypothetical protein
VTSHGPGSPDKSQEPLHDAADANRDRADSAQTKALRLWHREVDGEYLLPAKLGQPEGLVHRRARLADRQVRLELAENARRYIAEQGFDPGCGARPLRRFVARGRSNPDRSRTAGRRSRRWCGDQSGLRRR